MAIAAAISTQGVVGSWEGLPILEVFRATLDVHSPMVDDPIIAQHGDPERIDWMHANFTDHSRVAELGDSDSYATRLYDYAHAGHDQVRWVIDRLAANPHQLHPMRQPARLLAHQGRATAGCLCSRHRLPYEGLRESRRARSATN